MRPVEGYLEKGFSPFNCWTAQEHHPTFFRGFPWLKNRVECLSFGLTA